MTYYNLTTYDFWHPDQPFMMITVDPPNIIIDNRETTHSSLLLQESSLLNIYSDSLLINSRNPLTIKKKNRNFLYISSSDHELSDNEISNHRHVYVGFHLPSKKRNNKTGHNGGGGHNHGHRGHAKNKHLKVTKEELRPGDYIY